MSDLREASDEIAALLDQNSHLVPFLEATMEGSPYLRGLMLRDAVFAGRCLSENPEALIIEVLKEARESWKTTDNEKSLMSALRLGKRRAALLIGLSDLAGIWDGDMVTRQVTAIADTTLLSATDYLLAAAARQGKFTHIDPEYPSESAGYFVLAMGKHGAYELNYSSDVDLMVFYDPLVAKPAEGVEMSTQFVRMTRTLVSLMQDMTGDGYVFRMDLRLRPDPRSTPLAISVEAAMSYYESMGQNWERAALIKARPVAGDIACGELFLKELQPFIFRRYLDFAAIADVQSMKRQIHAHKGHGKIAVAGHNIKLGRGGIREVEFFVQTQQLIAGGRAPELRGKRTIDMLNALAEANWIEDNVRAELTTAYWFLRRIEHRIQMVNDTQTHSLPSDDEALEHFARFAGYETVASFSKALLEQLNIVQSHYGALFEDAGELASDEGSLSFTGAADDPETLQTLEKFGFRQPAEISSIIRSWHHGRFAATRSERARERLTEIMPDLLQALARSADPDAAFTSFDRFLQGLPAGVQLFSLLSANRNLLDLLATVLGTAPRLAETLAKRPRTLDAMLSPGFLDTSPEPDDIRSEVDNVMKMADGFEPALDMARVAAHEQMFRIGVALITGATGHRRAGRAYSALADSLIQHLLRAAYEEIVSAHGKIDGASCAVVALGKLGSEEMTAASDLDIMVIYDVPEDATGSDGARSLSPNQYFARLTQRLISALSAPTAEGLLYEVDMRLRPSGNKGPIAVSLPAMVKYHESSAWTWERMALCRARVVAGDSGLKARIENVIQTVLTAQRDVDDLRQDVISMRKRMLKELYKGQGWDLKQAPGGLVEVEFTSQFLQLAHAASNPEILNTNTGLALQNLRNAGFLSELQHDTLDAAYALYQTLTQVLRLSIDGAFSLEAASADLVRLLLSAADVPDTQHLESRLAHAKSKVRRVFCDVIGELNDFPK
ncbi:MAG: bifunctional [glutamine synthetase] adenylyltransferase/[glutamine synthetase]-adenylyl-L-tyrosine phosphorylase [Hyphomicrobiales bacterium]